MQYRYPVGYEEQKEEYSRCRESKKSNIEALKALTWLNEANTGDYTLWVERRELLRQIVQEAHTDKNSRVDKTEESVYTLEDELSWTKELLQDNTKNYQVWHHMKCIVQWMKYSIVNDEEMLEMGRKDAKNMHYWGLVLSETKTEVELHIARAFTAELIQQDVRNNSAYSARYSILKQLVQMNKKTAECIVKEEAEYIHTLKVLQNNNAYRNYVKAIKSIQ